MVLKYFQHSGSFQGTDGHKLVGRQTGKDRDPDRETKIKRAHIVLRTYYVLEINMTE